MRIGILHLSHWGWRGCEQSMGLTDVEGEGDGGSGGECCSEAFDITSVGGAERILDSACMCEP